MSMKCCSDTLFHSLTTYSIFHFFKRFLDGDKNVQGKSTSSLRGPSASPTGPPLFSLKKVVYYPEGEMADAISGI